jgi:gliding motility-associated-like protein
MKWLKFLLFLGFCHSLTLRAAEPTVQASNITFSAIDCISASLYWTNGNGAWRIVIVKEASAVDGPPVDGVKYTSNPSFTNGSQIGTGNYVCYSNIGNGFSLTNLKQNTTYYVAVYEHDGISPDYLTSSPAVASFTTKDLKLGFNYTFTDSCQNSNVIKFKNTSTTTLSGVKYTWLFKDGSSDTGFNVNHTYTKGGNFYVQVLAIPSGGCANSYTLVKPVLIVPRPKSKPVEKNNDTAQCFTGNHFWFNDQTTLAFVPNTGYVRTWYFAPNDSATFPTPDKVYTKPGIYRIFFKSETLYDNKKTGCTDTTSLIIRIIPDPSSGVKINDSIQCLVGNKFDFDNVYPGLVSFNWDFGDGNSSSIKASSHIYATIGTFPVIHQAASIEGCSSKDTSLILVKPNSNAIFTGLPPDICEQSPAILVKGMVIGGLFTFKLTANTVYSKLIPDSLFNPNTPGSYTVKYLIPDTFCPDSSTQSILVKTLPKFSLGADANICNGGSLILNVSAPGTVIWDDGSTGTTRNVSTAGKFWAVASDQGCLWSDTINLYIGTTPVVDLPDDTLLCRGALLKLTANWPNSNVSWSNGSKDTTIYVSAEGVYTVTVTNPCGSASDNMTVHYAGEYCDVFVPDAFTPNGDGKNEFFEIQGRGIQPKEFMIYDRWGAIVFDSRTQNIFKWDGNHNGKPCADAMYSYLFYYEVVNGDRKRRNTIKGAVLLYR